MRVHAFHVIPVIRKVACSRPAGETINGVWEGASVVSGLPQPVSTCIPITMTTNHQRFCRNACGIELSFIGVSLHVLAWWVSWLQAHTSRKHRLLQKHAHNGARCLPPVLSQLTVCVSHTGDTRLREGLATPRGPALAVDETVRRHRKRRLEYHRHALAAPIRALYGTLDKIPS